MMARSAFLSGEDSVIQYKAGLLSKQTYDTYMDDAPGISGEAPISRCMENTGGDVWSQVSGRHRRGFERGARCRAGRQRGRVEGACTGGAGRLNVRAGKVGSPPMCGYRNLFEITADNPEKEPRCQCTGSRC